MHNAAFRETGVNGNYVLLPTPPELLGKAVRGLKALGFRGANVTVPYKQAVIPFLDELSPSAQAIGAVNTIVVGPDKRLRGENTDAPGFIADLKSLGVPITNETQALVLGAGGSARAVAYALASHHITTRVAARRQEQAQALQRTLSPHLPEPKLLSAHPWQELTELSPASTLIVNCTPVGMYPHVEDSPWPDDVSMWPWQVVYDIIYTPRQTKLMTQAQAQRVRAYNGLGMLVQQGALAWQLWSGRPAPLAVMRAAVEKD